MSNTIKDLISKTAGGVITREAALQALYEAVVGCVPEVPKGMDLVTFKRVVKSGGLHPNSTKYRSYESEGIVVEVAKVCRNEALTNLSLLFGVPLADSKGAEEAPDV